MRESRLRDFLAGYGLISILMSLIGFLVFLGGAAMIAGAIQSGREGSEGTLSIDEGSRLHLVVNGPLPELNRFRFDSFLSPGERALTAHELFTAIRKAAVDERVESLVIEVGQPAWSLSQISEFAAAMSTFREAGKPSQAFVESAGMIGGGNGAFAIACTADEVTLAPAGELALSGLQIEVPFYGGLMEKLGVTWKVEKRHDYKSAANTYIRKDFDRFQKEALTSLAADLEAGLIEHIAMCTEASTDDVASWIGGGPYAASQAKEMGLIDHVGYRDRVFNEGEDLLSLATYAQNAGAVFEVDKDPPRFALILAEGVIVDGQGDGAGVIASADMAELVREAIDEEVDGILLRVNSPGGSYLASDIMRHELSRAQERDIPIAVSMGTVAASGGYFISMEADQIFAEPGTITGSIGVITAIPNARALLEKKLGITMDRIETRPGSGFPSIYFPSSDQQSASLAAMADRAYDDFVAKAAEGRGMSKEALHAAAQGRVWSGRSAKALGLVDQLGGFHEALAWLKAEAGYDPDKAARMMVLPGRDKMFKRLLKRLSGGEVHLLEGADLDTLRTAAEAALLQDRTLLMPGLQVRF